MAKKQFSAKCLKKNSVGREDHLKDGLHSGLFFTRFDQFKEDMEINVY